jgi:hypothetical protein
MGDWKLHAIDQLKSEVKNYFQKIWLRALNKNNQEKKNS